MEKIALVTDSGGDLTLTQLEERDIFLTPFRIIYNDREYKDVVEISSEEIYDRLPIEVPKSSLPNINEFHCIIDNILSKGFTHVIVVTISSGLSGTFNALRLALEYRDDITSYVYDSKILATPQGLITLKIKDMIDKEESFQNIIDSLESIRANYHGWFTIDTLEYLHKGGRIGNIANSLGSLLEIKPIATINRADGVLCTQAKIRGKKKALKKMTSFLEQVLKDHHLNVWVLYGGCYAESLKYLETLKPLNNINKVSIAPLGPIFGMHAGPGVIALAYEII